MKRSRILFLAAALAVSAGTYCKDMATKAITTQSTLDQSLTDAPFSVLKFTAPWCGACKSPIFNELADTNKDIEFLVVDISKGEGAKIAKHYKIQGFPTFIFFKNEEETKRVVGDYAALKKNVASTAIEAGKVKKAAAPKEEPKPIADSNTTSITTSAELSKLMSGDKPVVVKFYTNWCGYCKKIKPAFDDLAAANQADVTFVEVDGDKAAELTEKYDVEGFPTFISFHKGKKVKTISGADKAALQEHVTELKERKTGASKAKKRPAPKPVVKEAPAPKKTKVVPAKPEPVIKKKLKVVKKEAAPAPAPKKVKTGPTHVEVKSLKDLEYYIKQDKPTAVKFYADWCGPCQVVKPIFESIADQNHEDMNFISINIDDAREIAQQYRVNSIPHIKIFKKGQEVEKVTGVNTATLEQQIKRHIK
ncbi:MAG TPA: thioredoxin family protein [Candidatus Babeliales bacterium]|nr:thioredoxin family protein [Candidatus Babeliales bacterium]